MKLKLASIQLFFPAVLAGDMHQSIRKFGNVLMNNSIPAATLAMGLGIAVVPITTWAGNLDIKTGAWEVTTTTIIQGMMIPKELLEKMSPAQRAKFDQVMGARDGKPSTRTLHSCVTQADLDRSEVFKSQNAKCTRKVIANSARRLEVEETCPPPHMSKASFKLAANSSDSFTGVMDIAQQEGGKVHVDMSGHWVSAVCKKGSDD
jgi:hypothetical protein